MEDIIPEPTRGLPTPHLPQQVVEDFILQTILMCRGLTTPILRRTLKMHLKVLIILIIHTIHTIRMIIRMIIRPTNHMIIPRSNPTTIPPIPPTSLPTHPMPIPKGQISPRKSLLVINTLLTLQLRINLQNPIPEDLSEVSDNESDVILRLYHFTQQL